MTKVRNSTLGYLSFQTLFSYIIMRNLTITLFLIFNTLSISAQLTRPVALKTRSVPGVALSEVATFNNNEVVPYTILPYGNNFFLSSYLELSGGNWLPGQGQKLDNLLSLKLYGYNDQLRQTGTIEVTWPEEKRDHLSLSSLGNKLLWTFATQANESDVYNIRAEVLDDGGKNVRSHELLSVNKREFHSLKALEEYSADRHYYTRVYAEESSELFLNKRDTEAASLTIGVFDENGEVVSLKTKKLNCSRVQLEVKSVAVDNDGRAYVLAKIYGNAHRGEALGGSDSQIFLYSLNPGAEELERVEMKLDGQYIEGISMTPNSEGNPAIAGVYRNLRGGGITGYFSTTNPRKGEVIKANPFSQELLKSLGRRITTKQQGELALEQNFGFKDAIRLSNGKLTILLESLEVHNKRNYGRTNGSFSSKDRYNYIFGEGVMLTFDQEGELSEATVVPKFQSTENLGNPFFRLNLVEYQGRPAAIYNDNPDNFIRDVSKRPRVLSLPHRALAVICYADENGTLQRDPIFARVENEKLILMPSSASRLINDDVVFMAIKYNTLGKNEFRFGRIRE